MSLARAVRTLHRRQWVPRPLETVFDFFEHPENLALITPPWLGLRLRTPGPLTMRAGLVIDYHVRALGWTTRWRSLIAEYDPPYGFRDIQVIGPYRRGAAGRRGGREPAMSLDVRAATLATEAGGLRASCARCRRCRGVCLSPSAEPRRPPSPTPSASATGRFASMLRDVLYYAQLVLEATLGVFGLRIYEEPRHHVVATLGDGVEIRRYAPRLAAETEVAGDDAEARSSAFRILFAYIAGANAGAEKIAMTAPVATAPPAETIAMTAPVETAPGAGGVRMRFFLSARYTAATAPRPTDARVHLIPVPEETMAVLRFSGRGTEAELARRTAALRAVLAATPWRPVADPVILFYDPPFTLPFLRRTEAAVRVERSGEAGP